jgi:hypothetical protein
MLHTVLSALPLLRFGASEECESRGARVVTKDAQLGE